MKDYLKKIPYGFAITEKNVGEAIEKIMAGDATPAQTGAFLAALALRGETAGDIAEAARILRSKAAAISAPSDAVDCCGTGGDGTGTYNISTAVALVAAACGVPVAKHGNRAASSKSGTADVLEALGVSFDITLENLEKSLKYINFCFMMAPRHHQAMGHVAPLRKELGFRTIFNLLGPLANPAGTKRQIIGVFDGKWLVPMAQALKTLGSERAWIVHGRDGLDEITVTGATDIAVLEDGKITERVLAPEDFGLPVHPPEALKGGDAKENAAALRALLGGAPGAYRDIVLANTAAVLAIHGTAPDLKDGVALAGKAIDSGGAAGVLEAYIKVTRT